MQLPCNNLLPGTRRTSRCEQSLTSGTGTWYPMPVSSMLVIIACDQKHTSSRHLCSACGRTSSHLPMAPSCDISPACWLAAAHTCDCRPRLACRGRPPSNPTSHRMRTLSSPITSYTQPLIHPELCPQNTSLLHHPGVTAWSAMPRCESLTHIRTPNLSHPSIPYPQSHPPPTIPQRWLGALRRDDGRHLPAQDVLLIARHLQRVLHAVGRERQREVVRRNEASGLKLRHPAQDQQELWHDAPQVNLGWVLAGGTRMQPKVHEDRSCILLKQSRGLALAGGSNTRPEADKDCASTLRKRKGADKIQPKTAAVLAATPPWLLMARGCKPQACPGGPESCLWLCAVL